MDKDFYIEESNPRKSFLIFLGIILVVAICIGIFLFYKDMNTLKLKKVTYEVGSELKLDISKYVKGNIKNKDEYKITFDDVEKDENNILTTVGEYVYKIKHSGKIDSGKIIVEDTVAPIVEVKKLTIGVDEEWDFNDFINVCDDYSKPCKVTLKNDSDYDKNKEEGTYAIDLIVEDQFNNKKNVTAELVVKKNFNSESAKKSDLKFDHMEPNYDDWNGEMMLTYSEAINADSLDDDERYDYLLVMASNDLSEYIPAEYAGQSIYKQEIIFLYNQYDYVIGFAIRVQLTGGKYIYLSK